MEEVFKDIKGYEGLYQVSNLGRVKSIDREIKQSNGRKRFFEGKIIKHTKNKLGYIQVMLNRNNNRKLCTVHRLVALAFLPNPDNLPQVNHKNEIKDDNRVCNLEWCTAKYNVNYGTAIERCTIARINGKCSKKVLQYDLDNNLIMEWKSGMECGRNGFDHKHVSDCCRGVRKTHKGFRWKYA